MKKHHVLTTVLFLGAALASHAADAQANWDEHCAKCHGADGKGNTKMGKKLRIRDLSDAKTQTEFTDVQAMKIIKEGLADKNGKTTMKPVEGLSDDEMQALVPLIRALKK